MFALVFDRILTVKNFYKVLDINVALKLKTNIFAFTKILVSKFHIKMWPTGNL